jgi:hypothetical protein
MFEGTVPRTIAAIRRTLVERGDPSGVFTAEVAIDLERSAETPSDAGP